MVNPHRPIAGLTLGLFTRLCSFSLFSTMGLAVLFHINDTGLEGFPLAVARRRRCRSTHIRLTPPPR